MLPPVVLDLVGLAAVISAVASLVAAFRAGRAVRETQPNGGSSLRDRVDANQRAIRGIGHQIGEMRADLTTYARSHDADMTDVRTRLHRLEDR